MKQTNVIPMIVEIPMGSSNKYEVDATTGRIVLDRVLYGANFYPGEYGMVENTLDWDGDPLDVIALATYPTMPGVQVNVRILGTIDMIDDGEIDTKLFGVFADDPRFSTFTKLDEVPQHWKDEIENFFLQYKQLQGKTVKIDSWSDEDQAMKELQECYDRFEEYKDRIEAGEKDQIVEEWHKQGLGLGK
ncbi:inorganic diphosphatase [Mesoplasma lactucae]|uniref:Inorganic pyrophosphatase n=1 Tax=Mesoplasma lactucae ATCC 49193 TaxID=81460 RepID=A0A291IRC4_9MOLU|nr:inorganic diphosphatase [Mesoplasma lactucae]ATG97284.1 inorganic diphosphatase [Mesoplasma lactucae ATCC 49193]ATZ20266.1 inorganic pyrophosphatase [Mesoplasma lactucae ATCC 49193]MCL8216437.1 Inorganic pyrophosphatase [Mesoplasma lactucae ATCC 49193]